MELLQPRADVGDGRLKLPKARLLRGGELFHRLARRALPGEVGAGLLQLSAAGGEGRHVLGQLFAGVLGFLANDVPPSRERRELGAERLVLLVEQSVALHRHGLLAPQRFGGVA